MLRNERSWSNFIESNVSSFLMSNVMLNVNIASMPLARTLSYIRKTISIGKLACGIRSEIATRER